eukprot:TRINITY_DN39_c0_g1_i2.p1 TRINITY_DN39_c0_g1~~TRINITY_DN39_c0_g1_i2.p1  ORF type:complete len:599 (+),score=70.72 TRINITY_DN39_c0_g1_i2:104-1798(+)
MVKQSLSFKSQLELYFRRVPQRYTQYRSWLGRSKHRTLCQTTTAPDSQQQIYKQQDDVNRLRNVYIETYGCQMNINDSEILMGILQKKGYGQTSTLDDADVILLNTCAIREGAESKIWVRLEQLRKIKKERKSDPPVVGVLGCMAERLKDRLLDKEKLLDLVAGPDAYKSVPDLIEQVKSSTNRWGDERDTAMNVQLSLEETYADIVPVRPAGRYSAFISIMRGCNNMCAFCIVPFTRGRERSRPVESILEEVKLLSQEGYKEVILLGQNVNSYSDFSEFQAQQLQIETSQQKQQNAQDGHDPFAVYAPGFSSVYKPKRDGSVQFAELLRRVAEVDPEMRVRFTSPHPKDFSQDVLEAIRDYPNICKQLHMPAQSGNTAVLDRMRRGYTRQAYDQLIERVRSTIPDVALSTDIIVGFCGETEDEHRDTVDLMQRIGYDQAFMFAYSKREKTYAARHMKDDVPEDVKKRRLNEVIDTFKQKQQELQVKEIGRYHLVLVEGKAKRPDNHLVGRTDTFKKVVFREGDWNVGDYVAVKVTGFSHGTLLGEPLGVMRLRDFVDTYGLHI